jgi:hypothetical protein
MWKPALTQIKDETLAGSCSAKFSIVSVRFAAEKSRQN